MEIKGKKLIKCLDHKVFKDLLSPDRAKQKETPRIANLDYAFIQLQAKKDSAMNPY